MRAAMSPEWAKKLDALHLSRLRKETPPLERTAVSRADVSTARGRRDRVPIGHRNRSAVDRGIMKSGIVKNMDGAFKAPGGNG